MKKVVSLYVLVDINGSIVYSGYNRNIVKNFKESREVFKTYKIVKLQGEINV